MYIIKKTCTIPYQKLTEQLIMNCFTLTHFIEVSHIQTMSKAVALVLFCLVLCVRNNQGRGKRRKRRKKEI